MLGLPTKELKAAIEDARRTIVKADRVLDNALAITEDIRAITAMFRAALVKDEKTDGRF